jgi:multiple sugar transport system substrate-binding protein
MGLSLAALLAGGMTGGALAQEAAFPTQDIQITSAWWGNTFRNDLHNKVIDAFVKHHPNVTVERQAADFDSYWQRLAVQAAGSNTPAEFQMQTRYIAQFGSSGRTLRPLDEYAANGTIDLSNVPKFLVDTGKYNGQQLMIPTSFSFRGLMYDGAALEKYGVAPPTLETTWDGYADILKQLVAADLPDGVAPAMNECEDDSTFYAYVRSHGQQPYSADGKGIGFTPEMATEYFKFWNDLQQAGALVDPTVKTAENGNSAQDSVFSKGRVLFQAHPANQYESVKGIIPGVQMTALPRGPEGAGDAFIVSGQSISNNVDEDHALVAAAYINFFLNDPEANAIYQGDNGIPASTVGREAIAGKNLEAVKLFEQIQDVVPPFDPLPVGYGKVRDSLIRICDQVAFGQLTAEQGAEAFVTAAKASVGQQ